MDGERYLQASSTPTIAVSMNVAVGSVVQDEGLNIKDEPADTDLDAGPAAPQHVDAHCRRSKTNANYTAEEPGLAELVKSEPTLLVKEEVMEDGWQDIAEQQCMQGPSTSAIVGSTNVFDSVADPSNTLNIKEELGAIDIGPTVLQHMDTQGTTKQKDMSFVKQERTINHHLSPILCGGVKEEIIEDEWQGSPTPQDSLMEQSGTCTALHSLHKECLETVCRVQLIRLDTFRCDACDALYIDAHKLFQHVQGLHGPGPKRSLHVKSPEISIGPQQCATADTDDQRIDKASQSKQRARSQLYSCDECGKTYASKKSLKQHYRNLHSTQSHKCTKCKKQFPSKHYLYTHTIQVHSEQQYECAVCTKIYGSKKALRNHVNHVHRPKPAADTDAQCSNEASQSKQRAPSQLYSCDECGKTFTFKKSLMQHYKNLHSTQSHKCTKCKKKFPSKIYLYQHTYYAHSEQRYECAVCKKIYGSKPALSKHVNHVHRPRPAGSGPTIYICDYCQKTFKYKAILTTHITQVHAKGSYNCSQCNKNFKCERYLIRHVTYNHTAVTSPVVYACDYCHKTYTTKKGLTYHMDVGHTKVRYRCSECNKEYKGKRTLQRHMKKVHSKEEHKCLRTQIHTCEYCQKTFRDKSSLQRHTESTHVAAHIHRCRRCDMNFKSRDKLHQHNTSVHGKPQCKCQVCLRVYTTKSSLRQHVKNSHNSKDIQFKSDLSRHEMPDLRLTADVASAAASTSKQQHNVDVVKEEPADGELELGPVVFQHMDCNYRPYKQEPQDDLGGLM